jgi:hypothetical protein
VALICLDIFDEFRLSWTSGRFFSGGGGGGGSLAESAVAIVDSRED